MRACYETGPLIRNWSADQYWYYGHSLHLLLSMLFLLIQICYVGLMMVLCWSGDSHHFVPWLRACPCGYVPVPAGPVPIVAWLVERPGDSSRFATSLHVMAIPMVVVSWESILHPRCCFSTWVLFFNRRSSCV